MSKSYYFVKICFVFLSVLLFTTFATTQLPGGLSPINIVIGLTAGIIFTLFLTGAETLLQRFNLYTFNIAIIGLVLGYFLGEITFLILQSTVNLATLNPDVQTLLKISIYLITTYIGLTITVKSSEELHLSIPFVKLKPHAEKKKDILVDKSILTDSRIIDLATSGLLDNSLVIPRFTLKELYAEAESAEENIRNKARRSIDVFKKLEGNALLNIRLSDTDFPEVKEETTKMIRLARLFDANILTADINKIQQSSIDGVRIINIHSLSNALKPITQSGEMIEIKVQRYGKEPQQGVGYLEDGTMVVINGGAHFIGDTIRANVLSVKHTSTGRMIFCNAADEEFLGEEKELSHTVQDLDKLQQNFHSS